MGLFDKVIQTGIKKGVENAIGKSIQNAVGHAVEQTVKPAAEKLAGQAANAAAQKVSETTAAFGEANAAMAEAQQAASGISKEQWGQAFSIFEDMANDMMKDMKVCPACDEPVKGDVKFCPKCGAKLPEMTVMEQSLCPQCGKQNPPGTNFCAGCGAKLPGKEQQENAQRAKDEAVLADWAARLPQFPVWDCGGTHFDLAELEQGRFYFSAWFDGNSAAAEQAVRQYTARLKASGFQTAGKYPSDAHLYKMVNGVCFHADTEHCFESDSDTPGLYFHIGDEPDGGFNYVKPEPKKTGGLLGGLFK